MCYTWLEPLEPYLWPIVNWVLRILLTHPLTTKVSTQSPTHYCDICQKPDFEKFNLTNQNHPEWLILASDRSDWISKDSTCDKQLANHSTVYITHVISWVCIPTDLRPSYLSALENWDWSACMDTLYLFAMSIWWRITSSCCSPITFDEQHAMVCVW